MGEVNKFMLGRASTIETATERAMRIKCSTKGGPLVELSLSYIFERCSDWNEFCNEMGLNPWIFNEGLVKEADSANAETLTITLDQARRHDIL